MSSSIQAFFDRYAQAINSQNFGGIKDCFKLPFILVHKAPKSVVSFDEQLEQKVKGFLLKLRETGIVNLSFQLVKSLDVAADMKFVSVQWAFTDEAGSVINQYTNSYILSLADEDIKIITLIVDDKHDLFIQLMK